jgi:hypothetical protein
MRHVCCTMGKYDSNMGIGARTRFVACACTEWASTGFLAFCLNFPWINSEAAVRWEETARHVGQAANFLRNQPGITKLVLDNEIRYEVAASKEKDFIVKKGPLTQVRRASLRG